MELVKTPVSDTFINRALRIQVTNLSVCTLEEKSWLRRVTRPKTMVLNDVSVCINQGEFVAILGPSGAGKTTFLSCVAGKCTLPQSGSVLANGTNIAEQKGLAELVPQRDVFMDALTVMEHLVFMTEMKLGSWQTPANRVLLMTLMRELKLRAHGRTPISALSGGQRRLLSLAGTLLSNPQILICDEPTTGLDSYSASLVVGILKQLAASGKIVISSVHQPSSDLFKEFNNIMLMAEGRLLFHGTQEDCQRLFDSIDLRCPNNYNPAEFYIRAVSSSSDTTSYIERILENSQKYQNRSDSCESSMFAPTHFIVKQRNWFKQVHLLLWRSSLTVKRRIGDHVFQLLVNIIISAMVICTCYVGISGTTQRGIQDLRGFLWLLSSDVCYSLSYSALYAFVSDLTLFRREVGIYRSSSFFVSRFLCFIPRCIIWPICYVVIASLAVELPDHSLTSLELVLSLMCGAVAAAAYGLGMSAVFTSTGIMGDVMPCADLPLALMSGAFLRISSMPAWLLPVKYISHFYFTMDAVSNIYWRKIDHIDCPSNSTSNCLDNGISVLLESGYSQNFVLEDALGLFLVTLMWCIIGYFGLRREEKKGYAY